mmetsp:Transcript_12540/g.18939  ORF Transcript_12540/g.18939 Transcript_12540/m.18939 type:complete len:259 (+) Transcript_12540:68-844(+)
MDESFEFAIGPVNSGLSLFTVDRTKHVCFIQHGEAGYNRAMQESHSADCLSDTVHWDSKLTQESISQCREIKHDVMNTNPSPDGGFDIVVVSPLTRALETASKVFGVPRKPGLPSFLAERNEDGYRKVPVLVREECRERYGVYTPTGRRSISETIQEFPEFDFSEIEHDEDVMFSPEKRETLSELATRAMHFLEWLNKRPERHIAVVSHPVFLHHMLLHLNQEHGVLEWDIPQELNAHMAYKHVVLCSHAIKDGRRRK